MNRTVLEIDGMEEVTKVRLLNLRLQVTRLVGACENVQITGFRAGRSVDTTV